MEKKKIRFFALILAIGIVFISLYASSATEKEGDTKAFVDVKETDWFCSDVEYVYEKGLMNGISESNFSPNDNTTRGMIVTILWRLENEPSVSNQNTFFDVENDTYYYHAIAWAAENKIVNGYNDTSFGPEDSITREQLATIFYRYATHKQIDVETASDLDKFIDKNEISSYAMESMQWAYANEIITGTATDSISPKGDATRCQIAAVLKRLCENVLLNINIKDESDNKTNEDKNISSHNSNTSSKNHSIPSYGGGPSEDNDNEEEIVIQQPTIKVNTVYGKPGEVIRVNLDLHKNPGILGMILSLEYDEAAMKLIRVENGEAVADVLTLTPSGNLNSGVRFVWDGIDLSSDDIKDGQLLTLDFELLDNVVIGKRYPLKLQYDVGDIVDVNLNEANPRIYQGFIEIE